MVPVKQIKRVFKILTFYILEVGEDTKVYEETRSVLHLLDLFDLILYHENLLYLNKNLGLKTTNNTNNLNTDPTKS